MPASNVSDTEAREQGAPQSVPQSAPTATTTTTTKTTTRDSDHRHRFWVALLLCDATLLGLLCAGLATVAMSSDGYSTGVIVWYSLFLLWGCANLWGMGKRKSQGLMIMISHNWIFSTWGTVSFVLMIGVLTGKFFVANIGKGWSIGNFVFGAVAWDLSQRYFVTVHGDPSAVVANALATSNNADPPTPDVPVAVAA
ncbi:hypothetical protein JKP88DRAFT_242725 [Tribonema minus]|uniref:Uncharacterized protein n=1 Tax=Tribonema minus TaxID=303371 RepID=A0A836CNL8_9STRA|nr:hypothetical protein JKP88DRAFT_242725 [Tribonema minus]